jgi:glycosyltransferase involved in cell wall biosynthesis
VFLSNRNLEPLYNVACTLEAFARIQRRWTEARLILAGDGSERCALEERCRDLGLRDVTFIGKVRPERMAALYDEADIYLNSSDVDNMPTSLIEAFACGLPVVTSDAGGIPYFVEHDKTALVFPKGDAKAMTDQIERLLTQPDLAQLLIANARQECKMYRWSSVKARWLALYHGE